MSRRPSPTFVVHFTHVDHLASIVEHGLVADSFAHAEGLLSTEIGNTDIKGHRSHRLVRLEPGGVVADYVPFYYAARSPMMSAIDHGRVPTYTEGSGNLIYLVTTVEALAGAGLPIVFTDRNAALATAQQKNRMDDLDALMDWALMRERYWADTDEDPSRRERRMAECLVHQRVPWQSFQEVSARSGDIAARATRVLDSLGAEMPVVVRREWYF